MNVPVWAANLALDFWATVGVPDSFPRNLRNAIARVTPPMTIVSLPHLCMEGISSWLARMNVPCAIEVRERPLHAMLVTLPGIGLIFLDGTDSEEEQRFSLAHELAHYLRDYWYPRERTLSRLGAFSLEVLDGQRPACVRERVVGIIERLPMHCQTHILERTPNGKYPNIEIRTSEQHADRLAFELLAPVSHMTQQGLGQRPRNEWNSFLRETYGLPTWAADRYARILGPEKRCDPTLDLIMRAIRGK